MKKDREIKQKLEVKTTNKNCFDGFKILVKNGVVQVEKDGIKTKKGFLYDDGAKDFHGNDWNMGALGNLVIRWENENKLEAFNV